MRSVGVHQGLAPVLDVVRDARWGRVEETIGEDPYLVGTVGTAYVRGLESAGVVATLKHFVGYSASRAGRNLAPVSIGPRELADVLLPPFEMAIRDGGARSVMNAYTDLDGVPVGRRPRRCSPGCCATRGASRAPSSPTTSRSRFLKMLHGIAGDLGRGRRRGARGGHRRRTADRQDVRRAAASRRSHAGRRRRGARRPRAAPGAAPEGASSACSTPTGRRCRRHSRVVDARATPTRCAARSTSTPPANRALARELAERAIVLLRNDGTLPLAAPRAHRGDRPERRRPVRGARLLLVPRARRRRSIPRSPIGIELPTLLDVAARRVPGRRDPLCVRGTTSTAARPTASRMPRSPRASRRCRDPRARRPRRPLRPRHERRGLRRRVARPAGRAAAAPRRGARRRHARRPHAARRPAVRARRGGRASPPRSCRRSSPARRAPARSPAC